VGVSTPDSPSRAYSLIQFKAVGDEDLRIIEGIASTPEPDRQGDVMESAGVKYALPVPFLWQHSKDKPIGHVVAVTVTSKGIKVRAQIAKGIGFVDEAWQLLKAGLVRGLSIGWMPLVAPKFKDGIAHYSRWELLELSAVTVPANQGATISLIKSLDTDRAALSGTAAGVPLSAGVPASSTRQARKGASTMNISEQITGSKNELQQKSNQLEELMGREGTEGGLSDDEQAELDTLTTEVKGLTTKITRMEALEAAQAQNAKSVSFASSTARVSGHTPKVTVTDHAAELPKGTLFTRYAMAKAAGKGSISDTLAYAKRWDAQTPQVTAYIKAEAGTVASGSPGWGSELVYANNLSSEFVELLRPQTIIGRVQGFRNVPFNVRIPVQSGGSTVNWVGEEAVKPVTELDFTTLTVPNHKIAGIIVMTDELIRLSSPSAEEAVRRDLTDQIAQFMDQQFIRIAVTAGANNPASITNGVSAPNASGTTLAALMADLNTAISSITAGGHSAQGLVIATTSEVALRLSLMSTSLGQTPAGFSVNPSGGTLLGYQVIVSDSVDADTMVFFKPSEIFLADDGRVTLDASNQATLDMSGGSSPDFNLWQRNCTAIRAERWITWVKRRTGAVAVIDTIAYVPGT
jgi:HK97 family phage major capsid protein/HK97 family phage prohead protease